MRLPTFGRPIEPPHSGWSGPQTIPVLGASGGAGASTLCALLAGAVAHALDKPSRPVGIIDQGDPVASPWATWLCRGLDPELGDAGRAALGPPDERDTYQTADMRRACGAIRGLGGVAVLTEADPSARGEEFNIVAAEQCFDVTVLDVAHPLDLAVADQVGWYGLVLVVMAGTVDGITAGLRTVNAWTAFEDMTLNQIQPVVMRPAGGLTKRTTALLSLLDPRVAAPHHIPHDPTIARRGVAEALAADAVSTATKRGVYGLAALLNTQQSPSAEEPAEPTENADRQQTLTTNIPSLEGAHA